MGSCLFQRDEIYLAVYILLIAINIRRNIHETIFHRGILSLYKIDAKKQFPPRKLVPRRECGRRQFPPHVSRHSPPPAKVTPPEKQEFLGLATRARKGDGFCGPRDTRAFRQISFAFWRLCFLVFISATSPDERWCAVKGGKEDVYRQLFPLAMT